MKSAKRRQKDVLECLFVHRPTLFHWGSKRFALLFSLLSFFALIACSAPAEGAPLPPSPPPTLTPSPTATIVWFPPTATPTLAPTQVLTPTLDLRPAIGNLIFEDHFEKGSDWSLAQTDSTSIALGKNEITLAIAQPKLYLYTLRQTPQLAAFYLELTAWPNLCRGEDEYGLLFRVTPQLDFYRLALTCNGQLRFDRFYQGKASVPFPKTYSGAVPPGAPSSVPIAIWASQKEITVFINDQFQFTLQESVIPAGALGLFARSVSSAAVTVNFSDLRVYEIVP